MSEIINDHGVCKFYIQDNCNRENCRWKHTKKQCNEEDCNVYTDKEYCYKCNKKVKISMKKAFEEKLKREGRPCVNNYDRLKDKKGSCENLTLKGELCMECFDDVKQYIIGQCRAKNCDNRTFNGAKYCKECEI